MSLIMQKKYRSKTEKSVNYTMVFAILFAFAIIAIGMASYVLPNFGFGGIQSVILVLFGSTILLFAMNSILVKITSGKIRAFSMALSFMFVFMILVLALLGSGILEIG